MNFCSGCGARIEPPDSKECSACGMAIVQNDLPLQTIAAEPPNKGSNAEEGGQPEGQAPVSPQNSTPPTGGYAQGQNPPPFGAYPPPYPPPYPPTYAPPPYPPTYAPPPYPYAPPPYAAPYAVKQKEKHVQFLFVTLLIFMIFLASRSLSAFLAIEQWAQMDSSLGTLTATARLSLESIQVLSIWTCVATFAALASVLTAFVLIVGIKNVNKPAPSRISQCNILMIMTAVALFFSIVCLILEMIFSSVLDEFLVAMLIDETVQAELEVQIAGSLLFGFVFFGFAIANLIKSVFLKGYLKQKYQGK